MRHYGRARVPRGGAEGRASVSPAGPRPRHEHEHPSNPEVAHCGFVAPGTRHRKGCAEDPGKWPGKTTAASTAASTLGTAAATRSPGGEHALGGRGIVLQTAALVP